MSLEPSGEEQERFRANFKIISSSFASMPFKIPGTAFHRGIKVNFCLVYKLSELWVSVRYVYASIKVYTYKPSL